MAELQTRRNLVTALRVLKAALLAAADRSGPDDGFWDENGQGYKAYVLAGDVIDIEDGK